jgi:predicted RNA-binding Zn ribbon-like protein
LAPFACLDLVNSRFADHVGSGEVYDRLERREWQSWFLSRWQLELEEPDAAVPLPALRRLRQVSRELLESWARNRPPDGSALDALNAFLAGAPAVRRLDPRGLAAPPRLVPLRRDWSWVLAEVASSLAELAASGDPRRLKTCGNPACTFMFYDDSQNRSRRWCESAICGNLVKVREFRDRRRGAAAPSPGLEGDGSDR